MKKLSLDLDALLVESFVTGGRGGRTGTVRGFDSTAATDCGGCEPGGSGQAYCADTLYGCNTNTACSNYTCQNGCHFTDTCPGRFTCETTCPNYTEAPMDSCYVGCPSAPTDCCP